MKAFRIHTNILYKKKNIARDRLISKQTKFNGKHVEKKVK